jgi:hypothetical protein
VAAGLGLRLAVGTLAVLGRHGARVELEEQSLAVGDHGRAVIGQQRPGQTAFLDRLGEAMHEILGGLREVPLKIVVVQLVAPAHPPQRSESAPTQWGSIGRAFGSSDLLRKQVKGTVCPHLPWSAGTVDEHLLRVLVIHRRTSIFTPPAIVIGERKSSSRSQSLQGSRLRRNASKSARGRVTTAPAAWRRPR